MLRSALLITLAISALCVTGCAEEELYLSCPFDSTINQTCAKGDGNADFTCVVTKHPQCPEDVCLSWKNSPAFCTRKCTPGGHECPADSKCAPFNKADEIYYCVSDTVLAR